MKLFDRHRNLLLAVTTIGFLIALGTRASVVVFTSDMKIINTKSIEENLILQGNNGSKLGKEVSGLGGFPFSTYSDCVVGYHGEMIAPACNEYSSLGESSIILNTIFWGLLVFCLLLPFEYAERKILHNKK